MAKVLAKQESKNSKTTLIPATFGSSLGTLFLLSVQHLEDSNPAKSWLILASPSISVVIIWIVRLVDKELKKTKVKALKKKLKIGVERALQNANLTDKEKKDLNKT